MRTKSKPLAALHDQSAPIGRLVVKDEGMDSYVDIFNDRGQHVCRVYNPPDSYAGLRWTDFIVRAANNFSDMLFALKQVSFYSSINHEVSQDYGEIVNPIISRLEEKK